MPLVFPDFHDTHINVVEACATFRADHPNRLSWVDESIKTRARYRTPNGDASAVLQIDRDGDRGHLHFDLGAITFQEPSEFTTVPVENIQSAFEHFVGQQVSVRLEARCSLPISLLPEHGILMTLLSVSTESCGANLCLEGAEMSIIGDVFTRLSWRVGRDGESVDASLRAHTESVVDFDYLSKLVETMRDGIDCFVLETGDIQYSYGIHSRTETGHVREAADA